MRNENELLELMPVPKAFLKLALPAIAAQLINILYNLVDKMFIGHIEGAEKVMGSCTWMLIVLSVILTVIMLLFGKNILQLFGASNDTIIYAVDYMNIYCLGTLFTQLTLGLNVFITAQGKTLISMCNVAVGAVTNIVLDAVFMNGFGFSSIDAVNRKYGSDQF